MLAFKVREPVRLFSEAMEAVLRKNDGKGGWEDESPNYLLSRLLEEVSELMMGMLPTHEGWTLSMLVHWVLEQIKLDTRGELECSFKVPPEKIDFRAGPAVDEAIDAGNFAMMIWDRVRERKK